jgi:hypothetical protein
MFICGMQNDIRMAVESIVENTNLLETALAAAIQYKDGDDCPGGAAGAGTLLGALAPGQGS